MQPNVCDLCQADAQAFTLGPAAVAMQVRCPRCGDFIMSLEEDAARPPEPAWLLSCRTRTATCRKKPIAFLSNLAEIPASIGPHRTTTPIHLQDRALVRVPSVRTRSEEALLNFAAMQGDVGGEVVILPARDCFALWCPDAKDAAWMVSSFCELGYLTFAPMDGWRHGARLTPKGWERVEELRRGAIDEGPPTGFVTMWFDGPMPAVYEAAIRPAIERAGYRCECLIDDHHTSGLIDDEIVAAIRRARFVVADLTHAPAAGMRGGVYFEAGFAKALGKPVIFTVCLDLVHAEQTHFDVNHFQIMEWEGAKLDAFSAALTTKIRALIGQGPERPA